MLSRLLAALACLMVVLQLALPSLGQASDQGTWVEICSDLGPVEVEISSGETRTPSDDCPDCDICLLCAAENGQARPLTLSQTYGPVPQHSAHSLKQGIVLLNPAQFWHDGRGPPRIQKTPMERASDASMATTLQEGGAPWI
ncbi:hypothetical protein RSK20926_03549 [Roseobacter sp. SK209-2-6]|uniref:DUF2946 family protein n=1 Tax=Roseobacter sp. SK209-2-6 TaxID=388739 RepID=UPI0000F3EC31|nr:hypothetical protein RSK20926_03549 [Roseobacter sp. SK209-2-6]